MPWYGVVLILLFAALPFACIGMAFHALWLYGDDDDA
jgi:hypothetical protein